MSQVNNRMSDGNGKEHQIVLTKQGYFCCAHSRQLTYPNIAKLVCYLNQNTLNPNNLNKTFLVVLNMK